MQLVNSWEHMLRNHYMLVNLLSRLHVLDLRNQSLHQHHKEIVVLVTLDQVLKKTCHQLLKFQQPAHQLSCCKTKLQNLKKKV